MLNSNKLNRELRKAKLNNCILNKMRSAFFFFFHEVLDLCLIQMSPHGGSDAVLEAESELCCQTGD